MAMALQAEAVRDGSGSRLVAMDGRVLPLRQTQLKADARGGLARVLLEQSFANPYADPLTVTYLLPLPADGVVSGFAFRMGDRRIVGEVERREDARERYEQALIEGRSALILEQDRSSLFTQELGNIPPRTEVVVEIVVDQRLAWLDELARDQGRAGVRQACRVPVARDELRFAPRNHARLPA
jgi:Ca-activated chloride channel homolog